jgi:MHS family proline/betaine transporter-like MFS transporter
MSTTQSPHTVPRSQIITASSIGTMLEWYDFSLFAFLTPLLATKFFPMENELGSLMLTYAVFAIGFLVRPIGAAIFGHFGDKFGRKKTLVFSILLMSIPTFVMGLLPTYQQIGMFAPILLIFLRICQGLSAGGESTGALLFVMESNAYRYRGFIGALLWAVISVGMLLGSFAAMLVMQHPEYTWLWRVPFLLGLLTGLVGYFLRKHTPESPMFKELVEKGQVVKFPLKEIFLHYKKQILVIMGIYVLSAMITYLIFIFMPAYASTIIGLSVSDTTLISTLALAGVTLLVPISGYLSDLYGRKKMLFGAACGFVLFSYPLYLLIATGNLTNFIIAQAFFVLLASCFQGPINALVVEQLPISVRYSAMAIGYNFSYALFGGTAPLVATYMVTVTNLPSIPGLYLMLGAALALIGVSKMRETYREQLA